MKTVINYFVARERKRQIIKWRKREKDREKKREKESDLSVAQLKPKTKWFTAKSCKHGIGSAITCIKRAS